MTIKLVIYTSNLALSYLSCALSKNHTFLMSLMVVRKPSFWFNGTLRVDEGGLESIHHFCRT